MTEKTDDMVTVLMRVDVKIQVPRHAWAREWGIEPHKVNTDVRDYVKHETVENMGSAMITSCGGTFTATVVERPATLLMMEGHELDEFVTSLLSRDSIRTLRVEPRPNGLAYKINEFGWSPTVGQRIERG